MKIYMKEIEDMISHFHKGKVIPLRFLTLDDEGQKITIKVKVNTIEEEKYAGNKMFLYKCQANFHGIEKLLELKLEVVSLKWFLFKI